MRKPRIKLLSLALVVAAFIQGAPQALPCTQSDHGRPGIVDSIPVAARPKWKQKHRLPATIPFPADNLYSRDREILGWTLFFDPRLSGSKSTSCASCRSPGFSWGDGHSKGVGAGGKQLERLSPTLLNLAWADLLF
jgi:cytochrome c peroxidase